MPEDDMVLIPRAIVAEARAALREAVTTSLVVKGSTSTPYEDDPRWTPWTRWLRPMGKRADKALAALARAEKANDANAS